MAPPSEFPPLHIVEPTQNYTRTIIALHGRGSNGPNFASELFEDRTSKGLSLAEIFPTCKWVFPSSQSRHSTVFQEELDEWFDIHSLTDPSREEHSQVEGLKDSITHILAIIEEEVQLLHPSDVVLLGISQGCATAIHALLAGKHRLGGFIGLAGWMPFRAQLMEAVKSDPQHSLSAFYETEMGLSGIGYYDAQANATSPVLLLHCEDDDVVDVELGDQLHETLTALGMEAGFKKFATGGHWIPGPKGFDAIVDFLENRVGFNLESHGRELASRGEYQPLCSS